MSPRSIPKGPLVFWLEPMQFCAVDHCETSVLTSKLQKFLLRTSFTLNVNPGVSGSGHQKWGDIDACEYLTSDPLNVFAKDINEIEEYRRASSGLNRVLNYFGQNHQTGNSTRFYSREYFCWSKRFLENRVLKAGIRCATDAESCSLSIYRETLCESNI